MHFTIHSVDEAQHCVEVTFHTKAGDHFNRIFRLGFDDGKPEEPDLDLSDGLAMIQAIEEFGQQHYGSEEEELDKSSHPLSSMVFIDAAQFQRWVVAQDSFKEVIQGGFDALSSSVIEERAETGMQLEALARDVKQAREEGEASAQSLQVEIRRLQAWTDVLNSPLWKRLWWWLAGWPLTRYADSPEGRWWLRM